MYDDKIEKLIERFRESKNDMGLTEGQISKVCGLPPSWIKGLLNGEIKHPRFYETMILANALGVTPVEIDEILKSDQTKETECECYIGVYLDRDGRKLMTIKDFCDITDEEYECFRFCPKCGESIDWDAIIEIR